MSYASFILRAFLLLGNKIVADQSEARASTGKRNFVARVSLVL